MAVTETYLREEFNHKYVGLDGLDFWIMCLDMGWRMGLEVEFQEEKISSKCFISLLLKKKRICNWIPYYSICAPVTKIQL